MGQKLATQNEAVAQLAARQHGVVTTAQLARLGISPNAASKRARSGRLHRLHRGVYAVGHRAPSWHRQWTAAVLACGEEAVLSHLSAAYLWQLLDPRPGPVDVSIRRAGGRARRRGIRIHRRRSLDQAAITEHQRIPVTTPAQTIADLASMVSPAQHRRAVRQAEVQGLRTGVEETEPTRSELEHLFLRLCEQHRLPRPEVNVRIGRFEVDFLWRAERLIVETNGYRYHRGPQAFEDDHARELEFHTHGHTLRRFTYRQVTENPERVAINVREALRTSRPDQSLPSS